ncbi:MAG: SDR family oxidoreductase [Hyphomonadaceae bacterium]|nr:SDR family oxidoreductase [Hyphomonadaceae bacterium]
MFKPFDLSGKTALVTGGNGGIGLGMAHGLAAAGADLVIWGTNAEKNARATAELAAHGTRITARVVDVANEDDVVAAMAGAIAHTGRLDACFANAGVSNRWGSFLDMGGADYRRLMAINLDGQVWTMREACRHMKVRAEAGDRGGAIVCVASMAALFGAARNEDYSATKAAVISVIKGIAVEFARYGVRANAILPGWVATGMTQAAQANDQFTDRVIGRVPMRRWGKPDEFAGIAVYLASDASTFHSGDAILIDGGYAAF